MPAPMMAQAARIQPEVPPFSQAASMMPSLVKNPENGGMPMIARYPRPKVTKVIGRSLRSAP